MKNIECTVSQSLDTPKTVLRRIRNYMAGQVVGITRDETLLEEVLKCAYCRVYLEREGIAFSANEQVEAEFLAKQYRQAFHRICNKFPTLFENNNEILLGPNHIAYIDREFATLNILDKTYDIIGDIYETFIGSAYRGQEGQFFTPKIATSTLIELTAPTSNDLIIDPACGSGSFLLEAAKYISTSSKVSPDRIHGIDKDADLVRLSQLHLALQFDTLFPISCTDSLVWKGNGFEKSATKALMGKFTLVLTNPPFGSKIVALSNDARNSFELAHRWRFSKSTGRYQKQNILAKNTPPQVLFVERCISLLAPGGRLGIVLPESVLSNPSHRYVVQYILDHTTPVAIIGMPESLFKTSGRGGTHTKVCLVVLEKKPLAINHNIFMAEAKWCGHDSRAREIPKNDLPVIVEKFKAFKAGNDIEPDHLGFLISCKELKNNVLAPRFYEPESKHMLIKLSKTHDFYRVSELVQNRMISISSGDEVGKLAYGTGNIPFVRTSDLSNWEIKVDPKHMISREIYQKYAVKQDVREGDILMVRDGTYLIGTCAYVSRYDTEIVYQSHILKIRVHENAPFDSYLLLAILSSPPVVAQIKSMSFTQDIIDTLGDRIYDLVLPVPKSKIRCREISEMVKRAIESRIEARELTRKARETVVAP
ncbi:N-6 DNA methylase [Neomoorella mulderi]|nr:N-6 DNA methylase [Moorella mulderi]